MCKYATSVDSIECSFAFFHSFKKKHPKKEKQKINPNAGNMINFDLIILKYSDYDLLLLFGRSSQMIPQTEEPLQKSPSESLSP